MKTGKMIVMARIGACIMCLSFLGCGKQAVVSPEAVKVPVQVMRVGVENLEKILEYGGDVKAADEIYVYPRVSGKVFRKLKQEGESVRKGEELVLLDRDEVGLKFEKAPVESPIDGVVGSIYVDLGTNVTSQTPVALVVFMDRVKIEIYIPEKYIPFLRVGQEVKNYCDAYPGREFHGRVDRISPVLSLQNRAAKTEVSIDNPGHELKSGMFVRALVVLEKKEGARVILKEALQGRAPDNYVFVAENGIARQRKVAVGLRQGAYYEITQGLNPGDLVVIMGQQKLRDGTEVTSEEIQQ